MIPLSEIEGININDELEKIKKRIKDSPYTTLPVYDQSIALVVDEYGEIEGLVSVEDIFIEIVGKFGSDILEQEKEFSLQSDGSVITDGNSKIRDLNKFMSWNIPDEESKTINGLALKIIDEIPVANLCIELDGYRFEIIKIKNNSISSIKIKSFKS